MNDGLLPKHWTLIEELDDAVEGQLLREMLEQQGVPCVLTQDGTARAFGLSPTSPVEIYVSPDKGEEARRLIREYFSGSPNVEDTDSRG